MTNQDQVTLVNEQDEVIGSLDKIEAHRGEGKLHRASSVFLFRKNTSDELQLLIQKRSNKKIVGAGQWANTVCGNVWPTESYAECAKRRLRDELGITTVENLDEVSDFRYQAQCNEEFSENEIVHIFVGWFDGDIIPNPEEVAETEWITWSSISPEDDRYAPWFTLFMTDAKLVAILGAYAR